MEETNPMLAIGEPVPEDESIESFEYREYETQNPAALNNGQTIQIDVHEQDVYLYPSKSYLLVEGTLTSATGNAYDADSQVALTNNAIPFMFSQIRYMLNNNPIDDLTSPGQATTMKGLLSYGDDFSKAEGLNMCWQKDTSAAADSDNTGWEARRQTIIAQPVPIGTFSFCIPLKHLFGICDDYHRVMLGLKHSLLLSRQADDDAIFRNTAAPKGKITLTKLVWMMPHVRPALRDQAVLLKQIEQRIKIPVAFRTMQCDNYSVPQSTTLSWTLGVKTNTESPRWILLAFQTDRTGSQTANPACFDHVHVRSAHALLNTDRYPFTYKSIDFIQRTTSLAYRALLDFKEEYYGIDSRESSSQVTPLEFVKLYPIHVIDVRRQPERLRTAVKTIQLKVEFGANVPVNTTAYAVIICDKKLYLHADGKKFDVVLN